MSKEEYNRYEAIDNDLTALAEKHGLTDWVFSAVTRPRGAEEPSFEAVLCNGTPKNRHYCLNQLVEYAADEVAECGPC
jgi:hypothetical protein